jgi:DNA-binding NtrC family response regulator
MGTGTFTCDSGLGSESRAAIARATTGTGHVRILGQSAAIQHLRQKVARLSLYNVCVVICGETGTGKELAARAIHYLGPRSAKPFVPVNCGAVPDSLFENELFGHARGAFTDARAVQTGLVSEAGGGTLFLDEIGAVSLGGQVKLLRLLQDKEYKRLGDSRLHKADIRIIAATNKPLQSLVQNGRFREDLFYRLNVVSLAIPALRERAEDIPLLTAHFVKEYSSRYGKPVRLVTEEAMQAMLSYPWPGNVRELQNKIQRMIVMSDAAVLGIDDVEMPKRGIGAGRFELEEFNAAKKKVIDSFERAYLTKLLAGSRGNVVDAARRAGKSRTALWNILKKHRLSPKQFCHFWNSQ